MMRSKTRGFVDPPIVSHIY